MSDSLGVRECKKCSSSFTVTRYDKARKYCYACSPTNRTANKINNRACGTCGASLAGMHIYQKYCNPECRREAELLRMKDRAQRPDVDTVDRSPRECKRCGQIIPRAYGASRQKVYCSDKCARAQHGSGNHRERAIRFGVPYKHIDRFKIFERDNWTCKICGEPTPKHLSGKFVDNAPEMDHIVPLSMGGLHEESNVQCACRGCNRAKHNNMNYTKHTGKQNGTGRI